MNDSLSEMLPSKISFRRRFLFLFAAVWALVVLLLYPGNSSLKYLPIVLASGLWTFSKVIKYPTSLYIAAKAIGGSVGLGVFLIVVYQMSQRDCVPDGLCDSGVVQGAIAEPLIFLFITEIGEGLARKRMLGDGGG